MSFEQEMGKLLQKEGKYSNNQTDRGKETYKGISRVMHPSWDGWAIIDELKKEGKAFPSNLEPHTVLQSLVLEFYKKEFWDKVRGDDIPEALASEMFDTAVNQGEGTAIKYLQSALNALNRNASLYMDMPVDGGFGPATMACLTAYLKTDKLELLLKVMNVLQGSTYLSIMKSDPEQETFARGWFSRVEITKV